MVVVGYRGQKRDDAPLTMLPSSPKVGGLRKLEEEEEEEEEGGCSQREKTMGRNGVEEEKQGKFRRCISPRRRATLRVNGGLERVRDSTRQPRLHLTEWNLSTVPWDVE